MRIANYACLIQPQLLHSSDALAGTAIRGEKESARRRKYVGTALLIASLLNPLHTLNTPATPSPHTHPTRAR